MHLPGKEKKDKDFRKEYLDTSFTIPKYNIEDYRFHCTVTHVSISEQGGFEPQTMFNKVRCSNHLATVTGKS